MTEPGIKVRAHSLTGCRSENFAPPAYKRLLIKASVGQFGVNRADDAREIQSALNEVPYLVGGPMQALAVDGIVGPKTIAAIRGFQASHFGDAKADGRVDPDKYTIARLSQMRYLAQTLTGPGLVAFWTIRRPARLARAALSVPDIKSAVTRARLTLEAALDYMRGTPDSLGFKERAYKLADLYFALKDEEDDRQIAAMGEIRQSFIRVQMKIDNQGKGLPGVPSGVAMFELDDLGKDHLAAYSPMYSDEGNVAKGLDPEKIYLCEGLDGCTPDYFNNVLIHELFHATDEETDAAEIRDEGYKEKAMQLPHRQRMRNAENYALFASHTYIGRERVVTMLPQLTPYIPED